MIYLDCSGVRFYSQSDEKHLFEWAMEIAGALRWERDTLVVRNTLSQASLRDLLALFNRYRIPMAQLAQCRNLSAHPRQHKGQMGGSDAFIRSGVCLVLLAPLLWYARIRLRFS